MMVCGCWLRLYMKMTLLSTLLSINKSMDTIYCFAFGANFVSNIQYAFLENWKKDVNLFILSYIFLEHPLHMSGLIVLSASDVAVRKTDEIL